MTQGENRKQGLGLKGQIVIPIALLMAMTLGLTGVLSYRASFRALDKSHQEALLVEATQTARELENIYRGYERDADFLSRNETLIAMLERGDYAAAAAFLEGFAVVDKALEGVFVASAELDSAIVAHGVDEQYNGFRLAGTAFGENVRRARSGDAWVSDPVRSPTTDIPVVLVSSPMYANGRLIGILGLSLEVGSVVSELVSGDSLGASGYQVLATSDGLVFGHPDSDHVLETNLTYFDWSDDVFGAKAGEMVRYDWYGTERVLVRANSDEYRFVSMATMALSELRSEELSLGGIFVIVGAAGLVVTIGIAILILYIKFRPITAAVEIADRIAMGDFNVEKLEVRNHDELWVLGEALDRMVHSLSYKAGVLETIASGDLSGRIETASDVDVLGHSLVAMTESLNSVLQQVNTAIEQVASGSDQVAQASQSLSQGATEQASSLEQITSSLTEINGQTKKNVAYAEQGNERMKNLVGAMAKINESSDKIRQVVSVIDDIAFQINLLALNANVEAARAGKYGKGFAVVAEEVRNLAVRSATAVKETTVMVDETVRNIGLGSELATETARQLEEVALASREQAQGVDQINTGLEQIDHVTQANTASAEESASAAEELASQARQLKALIARFRLSGAGGGLTDEGDEFGGQPFIDLSGEGEGPRAGDSSSGDGSGSDLIGAGVPGGRAKVNPSDVIKLDDEEFGDF